jgi:type IX secretion system PorP/SprF family membrane protein
MKTLKKLGFLLLIIFCGHVTKAQQDAMYTHYMYNTLSVNPAYAGSREALTATLLHRSQWVGLDGAPVTQTFTLHGPAIRENIGLGFAVVNDKIGPLHNVSLNADFSYRIRLTTKSQLAMGLKGGMNIMQANIQDLNLDNQSDISFANNLRSQLHPNFGFGLYYLRDKFYAGISTPRLMNNTFSTQTTAGEMNILSEARHYFFIAGAAFELSKDVVFKPTSFVKLTAAAPVEADLTGTFILNNALFLGAMFRTGDAFGVLAGYNVTDQFHVGYSFDWSYGIRALKQNAGSHEIMLTYDFLYNDKQRIRSPRYF